MQTHSQFSSKSTFLSPKYPITWQRIKTQIPNPNKILSNFFLYPSFPLNLSRNFRVSAHLGRPTSRKNYLRKKLTQSQHQQVSQNPTIHHPSSNFENPLDRIGNNSDTNSQLNSDDSLVNWVSTSKETKFGAKKDELDGLGSDKVEVLDMEFNSRNEMKSLMDQHNDDSEFWGLGSGYIFTVYENTDGKVERVDVDEAEILRRNDIEPLSYVYEVQEFIKEVNSKIAHAKNLAREMENGSNVLSKNSSVAKFVKSGGGLGFVSGIQRFTLDKPSVLSKWSMIGLTGLFGLVLILGWKLLFTARRGKKGYSRFKTKRGKKWFCVFTTKRGKEEYTRMEKEMLRRKLKARTEREKLEKGSVEVIQDHKEPEIVFTEKPQLDKQYLLNAIAKVMGETVNLGSQLLLGTGNSNSMEFDSKIDEIRRMARDAREIEKNATVQGCIYDKDDSQNVSDISNAKEVIDIKLTSLHNQLEDHTERPHLDKQDLMHTIDGFSLNVPFVTSASESTDFDGEIKGIGARDSRVREIEAEEEQTVNGFSNEKQVILKKFTSSNDPQVDDTTSLSETPYPQSRMPEDKLVKSKPIVINSVKEAREYLSKKHNKREKNQETEVRPVQEVDSTVNIQSKYGNLGSQQLDGTPCSDPTTFAGKTKESRGMDRTVREMEEMDTQQGSMGDEKDGQSVSGFSNENDVTEIKSTFLGDAVADDTERSNMVNTSDDFASKRPSDISPRESVKFKSEIKEMTGLVSSARKTESKDSLPGDSSNKEEEHQIVNRFSIEKKVKKMKSTSLENSQVGDTRTLGETPRLRSNKHGENSARAKPRIIQSVKEAREYLSQKHENREQNQETQIRTAQEVGSKVKAETVGRNGVPLSQHLGSNKSSEFSNTASAPGDDTLKREKSEKGEYAEEKEVDYLWWLDLPVVMCIEICKDKDGDKRIGLYSLEMGSDLELEPNPHHVIYFEDASDCHNFCYIIQSQMDMLGSGEAFVVAQYPKEAYRDAEANGFNITVIRKGELKLNVDQTLEEVEELITEIGSKSNHPGPLC